MTEPLRLAILLSGTGRTFDHLLERTRSGALAATIVGVISSRGDVRGLERARAAGLELLAQARRGGRHRRDHAHHRGAGQVAQVARLDLDLALTGEQPRRLGVREEVGAEAVVLDQEGRAVREPAPELHHRALAAQAARFAQSVRRVNDEAGVRHG